MRILYLLSLAIIINLVLVSGIESLGTFQKDKCVELLQTCSNCTYVNISSLTYPNSSLTLRNVAMSKTGTQYNYTFCTPTLAGQYIVNGFGDADGVTTIFAYDFIVTYTGTEYTTSQAILHLVFIIASIAVFVLCLYGAIKVPYRNPRNPDGIIIGVNQLKYLKIIFIVFSYILLVFIVGLLRGITYNYIAEIGVYRLFNWIYWIMLSFMYPIIVFTLILLLINFLVDKKLNKALIRGIEIE